MGQQSRPLGLQISHRSMRPRASARRAVSQAYSLALPWSTSLLFSGARPALSLYGASPVATAHLLATSRGQPSLCLALAPHLSLVLSLSRKWAARARVAAPLPACHSQLSLFHWSHRKRSFFPRSCGLSRVASRRGGSSNGWAWLHEELQRLNPRRFHVPSDPIRRLSSRRARPVGVDAGKPRQTSSVVPRSTAGHPELAL